MRKCRRYEGVALLFCTAVPSLSVAENISDHVKKINPKGRLATPVSSSASERVFSAVKLLVTKNRSRLSGSILEDIIFIRSLTE